MKPSDIFHSWQLICWILLVQKQQDIIKSQYSFSSGKRQIQVFCRFKRNGGAYWKEVLIPNNLAVKYLLIAIEVKMVMFEFWFGRGISNSSQQMKIWHIL